MSVAGESASQSRSNGLQCVCRGGPDCPLAVTKTAKESIRTRIPMSSRSPTLFDMEYFTLRRLATSIHEHNAIQRRWEMKMAPPHDEGVQRASTAALGGGRRCSTSRFVPCGRPERPPVAGAPIGRPLRANPPEACRSGSLRPRERGQEKPRSSSPCVRWLRWRVSEGEAPQPTPRAEASSWERECGPVSCGCGRAVSG